MNPLSANNAHTSMERFTAAWITLPAGAPHHTSANDADIYEALYSNTTAWGTPSEGAPHHTSANDAH